MISVGSVVQIYSGPPDLGFWGISSAGRAPGLHPGGHRFEPGILHHVSDRLAGDGALALGWRVVVL